MFLKLEDLKKMAEAVGANKVTPDKIVMLRWYHDFIAYRSGAISREEHVRNQEVAKRDLQFLLPHKSITVSQGDGSILIGPKIGLRTKGR